MDVNILAESPKLKKWSGVAISSSSVLMVLVIAHTLASLFWLVVGGVSLPGSSHVSPFAVAASPAGAAPSLGEMAQWSIFGSAEKESEKVVPVEDIIAAPKTSLRLTLLGVLSGKGTDALSSAVIAEKGKSGDLYLVGDSVPGGAKLNNVMADHVLLKRKGRLEALYFDEAVTSSGRGSTAKVATKAYTPSAGKKKNALRDPMAAYGVRGGSGYNSKDLIAQELQENIINDGAQFLKNMGLKPVIKNGQAEGYLVGGGAPAGMLKKLGLRKGDILMSVNGSTLGDLKRDKDLVAEVRESGSARIEIKRGKQVFTVNHKL